MNPLNQPYQFFMDEVPILLQEIEEGLITLQQDSRTIKVHGMMRAAHSLKGGAASVGLATIKNIAHKLEDYLKALYNDELVIDTELENLFLAGYDCLAQPLRQQRETGSFDAETAENKANAVWSKLEAKLGNTWQTRENYLPSSQDLGIDLALSLFEVDVAQEIRRLKGIVASANSCDRQQQLRESLEILGGFGELVDVPGFNLIVTIAQQALDKHPVQALAIAQLLIQDLEATREQVLNGDHLDSISPSAELITLAQDTHPELEVEMRVQVNQPETITFSASQPTELQQQSYQFFLEEAVDLLALIDEGLEPVFVQRNINQINEVARAAHSLKGGARSAGLEDLGNIALRLEKSLKALFNENIVLDEELKTYLRELYQLLREPLTARINNQLIEEKPLLAQADALWAEFEGKYAEEISKAEEFLPSSSDLGIDIANSIFAVDVEAGIKSLRASLESGNQAELQDTLTMQMEVFNGFGEMLNLPGFSQICQVGIEAFYSHPEKLTEIAQILIRDLASAQEQVLNGDRSYGGTPSSELLALTYPTLPESQTPASQLTLEVEPEKPIDTGEPAYSFFVEEAPELLNIIETNLLTLREARNTAKIHEIMRAAHSLKGGAASVGLEAIKTIAHKLEDFVKALYDETVVIDTELETWLLEGFDCLRNPLMAQINTGIYQPTEALSSATEVWQKIEAKLGDALQRADNYLPSSSDLGVDMVQSMFEVDVAEELARLKKVVNNPEDKPIAGELRATLEVFTGFGEMLNLPGFSDIAQQGLMAINQHPERALEISKIIIRDANQARNLVLAGDRTQGGEPSTELLTLAQAQDSENIIIPAELEGDIFLLEAETEPEMNQDSPSLSEVFGDILASNEQIFSPSESEEIEEIESPSLQEVFGVELVELNEEKIAAIYQQIEQDQAIEPDPSLEAIFVSEFSEEEINRLAEASQIDLEDEENPNIPAVEAIFTTPDLAILAGDELVREGSESQEEPSLDDVFGEPELTLTLFEKVAQEELEPQDTHPSLEEVFGEAQSPTGETELVKHKQSQGSQIQETPIVSPTTTEKTEIEPDSLSKQSFLSTPTESELPVPANLEQAIKSIIDVYPNLPGLRKEAELKAVSEQPPIKQIVKPQERSSQPEVKTNLTVRVDLERLERMNNLIGELSINRNGLSLQNDKLQNSVKELLERFLHFQQMANSLRDLADKMLVAPDQYSVRTSNNLGSFPLVVGSDADFNLSSAFDSLEMDRYDNMYYVVQELIEQMIQLEESVDDIALYAGQSERTVEQQRQMLNRIRDELMWARMLPLGEILNRFPRLLRDLSVKYHKKVNLKLTGSNVLVDKAALEKLYDPLVHLIRNAFDHGIETPEIRKQRGKPETGQIEVRAYHQGNQTIIEVQDDGGGLDLDKIGQKAVAKNLLTPEQLVVTAKHNLLDVIFEPGFSTASAVTEISGRGVGLDIVRSQLRLLKGTITVDSRPHVGTTFTLKLPLTLSIDKLLVLSSNAHVYALPSDNIAEIIVPETHQLKTSGNQRFLHFEHKVIPIYSLHDLLEYRCYLSENKNINQSLEVLPTPEDWSHPLLVIRQGQELFALEVDNLVSEQELVIKPFGSALTAPNYTYGCTILGDGTLIPVINTAILLEKFLDSSQVGTGLNRSEITLNRDRSRDKITGVFQVATILVVDDSAAMRRTLALSLEKSGYRVIQAKDGKEALEQLQNNSNISLIICDIEMPNMNGFEFLGQRRRYPELTKIPVAMLTSRSNEKHQKLATHLGANAYFTKPYIEQKFLQAINKLVEQSSPVLT
jgi:chemotaxis family two-component system sensor histidine kinase/response regulator PixL